MHKHPEIKFMEENQTVRIHGKILEKALIEE